MSGEEPATPRSEQGENERFEKDVGKSEVRKQRARLGGDSFVSWLGTFGLVGWSIALPIVAATAFGMWLDRHYHNSISWTITMLFAGLAIGCALAWYWIRRESSEEESQGGHLD